jgi:hypothetical protein
MGRSLVQTIAYAGRSRSAPAPAGAARGLFLVVDYSSGQIPAAAHGVSGRVGASSGSGATMNAGWGFNMSADGFRCLHRPLMTTPLAGPLRVLNRGQ